MGNRIINKRCLYISTSYAENIKGGRELVSELNRKTLEEIFGGNLKIISFEKSDDNFSNKIRSIFGYVDGLTNSRILDVIKIIDIEKIDIVFVDSSTYGLLLKSVKKRFPNISIVTFFHNAEYKFFYDMFVNKKSVKNLLLYLINKHCEKLSVNYSDKIICLNKRDSNLLKVKYKRGADFLQPLSLKDQFEIDKVSENINIQGKKIGLFIGGSFYANLYGVKWFVENVAIRLNSEIIIVGLNFEKYKSELEINDNIHVVGTVDNINDYYYKSHYIFSPIFSGAGMKTKTAEALMFGKTIFGTDEAFEGYDLDYELVGGLCNNADEFVEKINAFQLNSDNYFNRYSRKMYEKKYSDNVIKNNYEQIFTNII